MLEDGSSFEDNLAVLAVILMRSHGDKVVVTRQDIADARQLLADHEVQMVAYQTDRLSGPDWVAIEFRHRSRAVMAGEVVCSRRD